MVEGKTSGQRPDVLTKQEQEQKQHIDKYILNLYKLKIDIDEVDNCDIKIPELLHDMYIFNYNIVKDVMIIVSDQTPIEENWKKPLFLSSYELDIIILIIEKIRTLCKLYIKLINNEPVKYHINKNIDISSLTIHIKNLHRYSGNLYLMYYNRSENPINIMFISSLL